MREQDWQREFPDMVGGGIDAWIGDSPLGNQWHITMWFGDEPSGGELAPDEFAIELCMLNPETRHWQSVTYDKLGSRVEVLAVFAQMKATCD